MLQQRKLSFSCDSENSHEESLRYSRCEQIKLDLSLCLVKRCAVRIYGGTGGTPRSTLQCYHYAVNFILQSFRLMEATGYEAGWSQELVTMSWSREVSASARK
jgi:hypothetical protein